MKSPTKTWRGVKTAHCISPAIAYVTPLMLTLPKNGAFETMFDLNSRTNVKLLSKMNAYIPVERPTTDTSNSIHEKRWSTVEKHGVSEVVDAHRNFPLLSITYPECPYQKRRNHKSQSTDESQQPNARISRCGFLVFFVICCCDAIVGEETLRLAR